MHPSNGHSTESRLWEFSHAVLRRSLPLGNRYVRVPWFNAPIANGWKKFADRLKRIAEKPAPYGIRTGYHNHAHEFQAPDGLPP